MSRTPDATCSGAVTPLESVTPARSSSGPGHCPLKAEITGSNPVRATGSKAHAVLLPYAHVLIPYAGFLIPFARGPRPPQDGAAATSHGAAR